MDTMPPSESWRTYVCGSGDGGLQPSASLVDDEDDDYSYSVQPLAYIASVGESLLFTVQLLEPVAKGELPRSAPLDAATFLQLGAEDWKSVSALVGISRTYMR